jgi:hypothetical protein
MGGVVSRADGTGGGDKRDDQDSSSQLEMGCCLFVVCKMEMLKMPKLETSEELSLWLMLDLRRTKQVDFGRLSSFFYERGRVAGRQPKSRLMMLSGVSSGF